MKVIGKSIDIQGTMPCDVNLEIHEKPAKGLGVDQAKDSAETVKQQETVQNPDETLDILMKNTMEFIRNIDIKSL